MTVMEDQSQFVTNMRALWRTDPVLALRIDAVPDEQRLPVEATRSGVSTARIHVDNKALYLHSRYDPEAEARKFIDSVKLEGKYAFVVAGMGLGYHVRELANRLTGDAFIICVEPSVSIIATALAVNDFAELILSRRLIFLVDADKSRLHERLQDAGTLMMLGTTFVRHPVAARVAPAEQAAISETIREFVTYTRMSLLTLVSNSRITCRNIAMNAARYVATPPIDILRDRFRGNPAVVVAAGPSLRNNIEQLAALKGRAVLCAVQTTLRPLMQRGIVPDFVTSLDFHEMSRKYFEDVGDLSDVHLVAEPKATWHVIDNYPGPVSLLDNHWARLLLGDQVAARDGLKAGATVAHLAFYLAAYMGCDPIIFVGQDLAFTGHVFYLPGVEIHRAWRSEINRFCSIEHKEWERIARNRPILHKVPAVDGGDVYTDELLLTYLEQFESDIAQTAGTVIDATEGGARIRGTQCMSLAEAAAAFCAKPIEPTRFAYRESVKWKDKSKLAAARDQFRQRIMELDDAVAVCEEFLSLLDRLKGLTHDPNRFNALIVRVDELRAQVSRESRAFQIINSATQLAELRRFSADRRIKAVESTEVDRAKQQIERDVEFVTAVRDGAKDVKPMLEESLARIEAAMD